MVSIREITAGDAERVGAFLHTNLNSRVPAKGWEALMRPPWASAGPNHGFQLLDAHESVVGAYVAVYSTREGGAPSVCNLAAFCVLEAHRVHSLRLLRELLRQKGYVFTDLSPSGNVPAMNERLGFRHLDVSTRLVLNRPSVSRRFAVTSSPARLEAVLQGRDASLYQDHREAAAARHLLVTGDTGHAYLMYRRDRRKGLPVFASPLHAGGDTEVLEQGWPAVSSHLLRHGLLATLAERRVLGFTPGGLGQDLAHPRPRMYRGDVQAEGQVDYLYSEMTLLEW
jgi:hypothetical protein